MFGFTECRIRGGGGGVCFFVPGDFFYELKVTQIMKICSFCSIMCEEKKMCTFICD